jgi:hypothetical protein
MALSSISSDWVLLSSNLLMNLADSSEAEGFGDEAGAKGHPEALCLALRSSHDAVEDEHEGRRRHVAEVSKNASRPPECLSIKFEALVDSV